MVDSKAVANLDEEIFNMILRNKLSIFDFSFEVRRYNPILYTAEFRRTRGSAEQLRATICKVHDDINALSDEDWKTREQLQNLCYDHVKWFLRELEERYNERPDTKT